MHLRAYIALCFQETKHMNEMLKTIYNSFITDSCLVMRMSQELNIHEKERPVSTSDFVE